MGILDSVIGGLLGGGNSSASSPIGGILGSLLGGGGGGMMGQQGGGLGGLLRKFQQAGLGGVANSWVSNGQNEPVNPQQLQQVFGQDQVNQWAQQSNMQPHDLLSQLSQYLPHAVDRMTPGGQVPDGDAFGGPGVNAGGNQGGDADPFAGSGVNLGSRNA